MLYVVVVDDSRDESVMIVVVEDEYEGLVRAIDYLSFAVVEEEGKD